jgi:hypothetical protein
LTASTPLVRATIIAAESPSQLGVDLLRRERLLTPIAADPGTQSATLLAGVTRRTDDRDYLAALGDLQFPSGLHPR